VVLNAIQVGGLYAYKGCPCAKCLAVGNEFAFMSATSYQNEFLLDDDDLSKTVASGLS